MVGGVIVVDGSYEKLRSLFVPTRKQTYGLYLGLIEEFCLSLDEMILV